jgi:hypothetical protein
MGMSRIRLDIDCLVLNGFQLQEAKSLTEALQSQLSHVLSDPRTRHEWARSHRTPILKLGGLSLSAGTNGASNFGKQMANSVARGLMP